jgi:hypothetical protein
MKRATVTLQWVVRLCGAVQLVLGALIWFAPGRNYLPLHLLTGTLLVLALLTLAMLGLRSTVRWPLAVFTMLWSLALPAFGFPHANVLIGPLHWIIRMTHLMMGIVAIALSETIAKQILQRSEADR